MTDNAAIERLAAVLCGIRRTRKATDHAREWMEHSAGICFGCMEDATALLNVEPPVVLVLPLVEGAQRLLDGCGSGYEYASPIAVWNDALAAVARAQREAP